jgi:DtxR family Mn-dependent transcriptional regulator
MLTEIFGMEWYKVHEEAEQLEHAVSADFENKLRERLGNEDACPHGNRVGLDTPNDRRRRGLKLLDEGEIDERLAVVSVFERDRRLLEHLERLNVRPGTALSITAANRDKLTADVDGQSVQIERPVAVRVWVRPMTPSTSR